MIYPKTFESKIGFNDIRMLLNEKCLSSLGKEMVESISVSGDAKTINEWLTQVREFRRLMETEDSFPMNYFFDVRESVARLRLEGTHLEENEMFDLRRSLETIADIVRFLRKSETQDGEEQTGS
ncbi:MAG: endonuclease MutS2, partial [Prevotella sp.]|nr:endonuclease MutS2 [Prevotella sp.]